MNIVLAAPPTLGHANPLIAIGRVLVAAGHRVVLHCSSAFRARAETAGLEFRPFFPDADIDLRNMDAAFPERKLIPPGPRRSRFGFEHIFMGHVQRQHESLRMLLEDIGAEVVIAGFLFFPILPMLLDTRRRRPAVVHVGTTFLPYRRDDDAPSLAGLVPASMETDWQARDRAASEYRELFLGPVQAFLDAKLAAAGVGPLPMGFLDAMVVMPDHYLQPTVPEFEYPRRDLPSSVRFIGNLPLPPNQVALPSWADDVDGPHKIVLVTQGTVANVDLGQLLRPTIEAFAGDPDVLVLATTGGQPVEKIGIPLPSNARVAEFLPLDWLMPKVDALVTNGGYGTVNQALSLGVPVVVSGWTEDKREIGARVAWSGAGISLATESPLPEAVRTAVLRVLNERPFKDRATSLARAFAARNSTNEILRLMDDVSSRRIKLAGGAHG